MNDDLMRYLDEGICFFDEDAADAAQCGEEDVANCYRKMARHLMDVQDYVSRQHGEKVCVPPAVLGAMLISAVRYALGRTSYIVVDTCAWVRAYWKVIPEADNGLLLKEVRNWIRQHSKASSLCPAEVRPWQELLCWMEENFNVE